MRDFEVSIYTLSNKQHSFDFEVKDSFFEAHENSLIEHGNLHVSAILDKSETMLQFQLQFRGTVQLVCDRSLQEFDYPIELDEHIIFKYGEDYQELSEDLIQIPSGTQTLDLDQYLFEFISLAIPMRRLHPDLVEEDEDEEDGLVDYGQADAEEADQEPKEESTDPRWEKLKALKKGNENK